jgi:cyclase
MLGIRVMPCLLLKNNRLVKTVQFKNPDYIGDPVNAIKIYNEKEVDELIFLDISATLENRSPPFENIINITNECFMPVTYGGGISKIEDMRKIFHSGIEKIAINSYSISNPGFVKSAAKEFGNQSVIVSIDVKKDKFGIYNVFSHSGTKKTNLDPVQHAVNMEQCGAGEILLTSINHEGMMNGYDIELISRVSKSINIPLIAHGGAGSVEHFKQAVKAGASAVAAGSMVVYQGKNKGVLINFPSQAELKKLLNRAE